MRIRNIIANCRPEVMADRLASNRQHSAGSNVQLEIVGLPKGPVSLETPIEEVMAGPYVVDSAMEAEAQGFDAVTLDCFGDPAIRAARQAVNIPVVGPGVASMLFAMALGDRFSVICVKNGAKKNREKIRQHGFEGRVASIRTVDIPLGKLVDDRELTLQALLQEAKKAVEEDGADVVVLGCTGMSEYAPVLTKALGVPVIDPWACAVKLAVDLVEMGLSHSKVAYPPQPPERQIIR